jgi:hypothetical protein
MSDQPFAYAESRPLALAGMADLLWCVGDGTTLAVRRGPG